MGDAHTRDGTLLCEYRLFLLAFCPQDPEMAGLTIRMSSQPWYRCEKSRTSVDCIETGRVHERSAEAEIPCVVQQVCNTFALVDTIVRLWRKRSCPAFHEFKEHASFVLTSPGVPPESSSVCHPMNTGVPRCIMGLISWTQPCNNRKIMRFDPMVLRRAETV